MNAQLHRSSGWVGARLSALAAVAFVTSAWGQTYTAIEVDISVPFGVSDSGQIAGSEQLKGIEQPDVMIDGNVVRLSALHNDDAARAIGVTSSGLAAGFSCRGALFGSCTPVTWANGGPPVSIAGQFFPEAMNEAGDIVGYSPQGEEFMGPTVWRNGTLTQLPLLPGSADEKYGGFAFAISSNGLIAGELDLTTAYPDVSHAVLWNGNKVQDLGSYASAKGVNSHGQVVGYANLDAASWINGVYTDLGNLGGQSFAYGINDDGIIVGSADDDSPYHSAAVIWINGVLHRLDDLLDPTSPADIHLVAAYSINASGQIVADGVDLQAQQGHTYFLTPRGVRPVAAAPTFSLLPQTYAAAQTVALADADAAVVIHYTLDGSAPTAQSAVYKTPLTIRQTTTIKASAIGTAYAASVVASATYTIEKPKYASTPVDLSSVANVQAIGSLGLQAKSGLDGLADEYASDVLGHSLVWADVPFEFLLSATMNGVTSATIPLPSGQYAELKLVGTSTHGSRDHETFVVTYTDGTSTYVVLEMSDWAKPQSYPGESTALTMEHRISKSGVLSHGPYNLYGYSLGLDSTKTVKSLTLPSYRYVVILAGTLVGKAENTTNCARISMDGGCGSVRFQ